MEKIKKLVFPSMASFESMAEVFFGIDNGSFDRRLQKVVF
jgi:hypothetical protein